MANITTPVESATTMQLTDKDGNLGYPVTTPDRVVNYNGKTASEYFSAMVTVDKTGSIGSAGVDKAYSDGLINETDSKPYVINNNSVGSAEDDALWTASKILAVINSLNNVLTDNDGNKYRLGFNEENKFGLILVEAANTSA